MPGHRCGCAAAFLLFAGLSISPASSNQLTDFFNPTPQVATTPSAPAPEACESQPGKSTAPGQRWVYRHDGRRKCWFEAEVTVSVKQHGRHHAIKRPVVAHEETETVRRKKTVLDARAELLTAPSAQAKAPSIEMVDAAPASGSGAAVLASPDPVPAQGTIDQPMPDHSSSTLVDTDRRLADASLDKETAAFSVSPTTAAAAPSISDADHSERGGIATGLGSALIALGLVLLTGSLLASRLRSSGGAIRRA